MADSAAARRSTSSPSCAGSQSRPSGTAIRSECSRQAIWAHSSVLQAPTYSSLQEANIDEPEQTRLDAADRSDITSNEVIGAEVFFSHFAKPNLLESVYFSGLHSSCPSGHRLVVETLMKLSARNAIRGTVLGVTKGQTTAHVQLD